MILSQNRAKAVFDYLVDRGINPDRLNYEGFGSSSPVITDEQISNLNTDEEKEEAHQRNRRTEYVIIAM